MAREMQKSAAVRSERGHVLCVPGCRNLILWLVCFCIMKLNVRWRLKHSSGKASVWNRSGVDDIRFLIFSLLFSLTAPDCFYFLLSILWWKASTWHCYYVRLYPEHPQNAQAEPPLKYVCRADSRPLLACWWMLGLWVTDTCLMRHQLVLGSGWGSHLTNGCRARHIIDITLFSRHVCYYWTVICWGWWVFGAGAFFCIPPLEGRPSDVSWVCLPRVAVLKASADPRGWAHYSFGWLLVWNYSETLDSSPLSLHRLCSHHAVGKPNRLCTVNFIISLLSTWWTENSSLNCSIARQDPSPSVSLVFFYLLPRILSTPARILFYFLRLLQFKMPDFFWKAADLWRQMCEITPKLLKSSIDVHGNKSFVEPKSVLMVY